MTNSEKAQKYYNRLSKIYDDSATKEKESWTPPLVVSEELLKISNPSTSILDIGIGTGLCIEQLLKTKNWSHIEGIDISENMIDLCRDKFPSISLNIGDFLKFKKFEKDSYDLTLCCGASEFIDDFNKFVNKVSKLTKKEGAFIFTYEPIIDFHPIQKDKISVVSSERSSKLHVEDFMTYRRTFSDVLNALKTNDFELTKLSQFIAYKKFDIDVIYNLAVARRISSAA